MCEPRLAQLLDAVEPRPEQLVQRPHGVDRPSLAHIEDHLLGDVDRRLHVFRDRVADVGDVAGHADEAAQQGVLLHDLGVVACVGDGRGVGLQRDEDGRVPDLLEQPRALQLVGHGDGVDGLTPLHQGLDGREDVPVRGFVEVAGGAGLDADRGGVVGKQHGPEQGLLGIEVVRGHPRTGSGRRGGPDRPGAGVVEGLDHGPPTLTVGGWGP